MTQTHAASTRPNSTYSQAGRIGLIVPPTNTVNEAEWARLVPEGVTAHSYRMNLHPDAATAAGAAALRADLAEAIGMLLPMRPDVVAYACTAGSMVTPSSALPGEMTAECGVPVVTTADSIVRALAALGAKKVSIATPYCDAKNDEEVAFMADHAVETLAISGFGLGQNGPSEFPLIAQLSTDQILAAARGVFQPGSDAILLTCTDFPTLPLIPLLEAEFGVPVISSNTATLWACLRETPGAAMTTDVIDSGGVLLRDMPR